MVKNEQQSFVAVFLKNSAIRHQSEIHLSISRGSTMKDQKEPSYSGISMLGNGKSSLCSRLLLPLLAALCCIFVFASQCSASETTRLPGSGRLLTNGSYGITKDGRILCAENLDKSFIPASTLKILTALSAIETLGRDYHWTTTFHLNQADDLIIRGSGDPFLTSEAVIKIAEQLRVRGITDIKDIFLDDSLFSLEGPPPGSEGTDNPYDAESSALAVNFNSLPFRISSSGTLQQLEKQTPILPLMQTFASGKRVGKYRINISSEPDTGSISNILRYSGELFQTVFDQQGIHVSGRIRHTTSPTITSQASLVYRHYSELSLDEVIRRMLLSSNNFIANQLFLLNGASRFGLPATWAKGREAQQLFLQERFHFTQNIQINDGSGLCRKDTLTARQMLLILDRFKPYASMLRKSGTTRIKSGTMTDVYCYAGYFERNAELLPYTIFLNQKRNNRKELLRILQKYIADRDPAYQALSGKQTVIR